MKSIKTKLLLIFAILIILPLITLGGITYVQSSNALQSSINTSAVDIASTTAELINAEISSVKRILSIVQSNENIQGFLQNGSNVYRARTHGQLKDILVSNSDLLESLILVNTDKLGVISDTDSNLSLDLSDRGYLIDALSGRSTISNVLTSKATGNKIIVIVEPIIRDDKVIGAVLGTMLFSRIEDILSDIQLGEEGYAYMIDGSGIVISHPDQSLVENKTNLFELNNEELSAVVIEMINGETSNDFYTFDGIYKMVAYAPIGKWSLAVTANYDDYMSSAIKVRNLSLITTIVAIIISMIIALVFSNMLVKPIRNLQSLMKQAGEGILTVRSQVKLKDEIGDLSNSFNSMISDLSHIVYNVKNGAHEMVEMATDLAASSEEITAIGEETRAASEQITSDSEEQNDLSIAVSEALVELSSLVVLAKNKAAGAEQISIETKEMAIQGRKKVEATVEAMTLISDKSGVVNDSITDVDILSRRISEITNAIGDVADQTNLLALNAAIEASRAGEHGKGFMVVADEIRKLAEQTTKESEKIRKLIDEMVGKIQVAVNSVSSSLQSIEDGNEVANETDAFFLKIVEAVEKTASDIFDIMEITKNEVTTSDQVVKLIDDVSSKSESNLANIHMINSNIQEQSAALETISASSEETNAVAESLSDMVERFVVDMD